MTRDQYPIAAIIATDYCHLRVVTTTRSLRSFLVLVEATGAPGGGGSIILTQLEWH